MDLKQRRARVAYSYQPQNDDELQLEVSDVIEVLEEVEEGWWKGVLRGRVGVFPSNFVVLENAPPPSSSPRGHWGNREDSRKGTPVSDSAPPSTDKAESSGDVNEIKPRPVLKGIGFGNILPESRVKGKPPSDTPNDKRILLPSKKPPPPVPPDASAEAPKLPPKPVREQAKVLYAYEAQNDDELTIREGDLITIITKEVEDKGWWKGELNGRVGVFPDNFVKLVREEAPPPSKPDRPEKPPSNKTVAKPDPLEKPAFSEFGSNADRPVSKVPPFKPSDIAKKAASSATQTTVASANVDDKKESKRSLGGSPSTKKSAPPPLPPAASSGGSKRPRPPSVVEDPPPSKPPSPPPLQLMAETPRPSAPPAEEPEKAPTTNGLPPSSNGSHGEMPAAETFDAIEPSENRLNHPTANRAKPPTNRRPPSHIVVVKENGNESTENQPAWMKELGRRNQAKFSSQPAFDTKVCSPEADASARATPQKSPPSARRPVTAQPKEEGATGTTPLRSPVLKDSTLTPPSQRGAESVVDTELIQELRSEMKALKESTVTKEEYKDLLQQMSTLKETVEANRAQYSKLVRDLINEVDEEKKLRMTLQVEIDRLKKLTLTV